VRDPTATNPEVEAAIESACESFWWIEAQEWSPQKKPVDIPLHHEASYHIKGIPGLIMPARVREYILGVLSRSAESQRHTYAAGRDQDIVQVVHEIATKHGFPPTRNRETRRTESACSIVAKALARLGVCMSERSIEDIWARAVRDDETLKRPVKTAP
jgi:hypothetical protein